MIAFDNKKYLELQSKEILDRVKTFDNKFTNSDMFS